MARSITSGRSRRAVRNRSDRSRWSPTPSAAHRGMPTCAAQRLSALAAPFLHPARRPPAPATHPDCTMFTRAVCIWRRRIQLGARDRIPNGHLLRARVMPVLNLVRLVIRHRRTVVVGGIEVRRNFSASLLTDFSQVVGEIQHDLARRCVNCHPFIRPQIFGQMLPGGIAGQDQTPRPAYAYRRTRKR